jgi:hypothetical protein
MSKMWPLPSEARWLQQYVASNAPPLALKAANTAKGAALRKQLDKFALMGRLLHFYFVRGLPDALSRQLWREDFRQLKGLDFMRQVLPKLNAWASRHQFQAYEKRFKPSAYFGCTAMPDLRGAELMSCCTLWMFVLDDCTDESPTLEELDERIRQLARPLVALPEASSAPPGLGHHLANAFEEIRDGLLEHRRPHLDEASLAFCRETLTEEIFKVAWAMSWERLQSLLYSKNGRHSPISLDEYLEMGRYSICVRASAAISLPFEREPQLVWARWQQAMDSGANVLRLTNDLANIQREFEEGKLNAVSLTLLNMGWDGQSIPAEDDPRLNEAITVVNQRLLNEVKRFTQEVQALPQDLDQPVYSNVVAGVAFTIAMYRKGDFLIPASTEVPDSPPSTETR